MRDMNEGEYLNEFLTFLDGDIKKHPENLTVISESEFDKIKELTDGVDIDINKPLK